MHQEGKETSMNPLGMVEALLGAMNHRCVRAYSCACFAYVVCRATAALGFLSFYSIEACSIVPNTVLMSCVLIYSIIQHFA